MLGFRREKGKSMYRVLGMAGMLCGFGPLFASSAFPATESEYCAGFEEGYRSVQGDMVLLPLCSLPPLTPLGSTPYRDGIQDGIARAMADPDD